MVLKDRHSLQIVNLQTRQSVIVVKDCLYQPDALRNCLLDVSEAENVQDESFFVYTLECKREAHMTSKAVKYRFNLRQIASKMSA